MGWRGCLLGVKELTLAGDVPSGIEAQLWAGETSWHALHRSTSPLNPRRWVWICHYEQSGRAVRLSSSMSERPSPSSLTWLAGGVRKLPAQQPPGAALPPAGATRGWEPSAGWADRWAGRPPPPRPAVWRRRVGAVVSPGEQVNLGGLQGCQVGKVRR